jgi:putative RNA 2'-phosphotransferase
LTLGKDGWISTSDLIQAINKSKEQNWFITLQDLKDIVATDNKQRYSFSSTAPEDSNTNNDFYTYIRANQGHSIKNLDIDYKSKHPEHNLYHGTSKKTVELIEKSGGLKPMSRLYVHLSSDKNTAINVGSRHGTPVVYEVDTASMEQAGYEFYQADNGVWLTKEVPMKYLKLV